MITLAIDIGGTKLAAALVDSRQRLIERHTLPTPASQSPVALNDALAALTEPFRGRAHCVAVASTGIIQNGILSALNPDNLGGLAQFPLTETLSRLTGLPCLAVNDAQAATWAEFRALPGILSEMVFITVSTGVGGGIICQGKLLSGTGGLAGHIGHTLADPHGPRCGCGRTGCVEAIASGRGISATATNELQGMSAKAIFAQHLQGHPQASALVQRSAQTIARLIADLKAVTDCQCVVIGGSVGLATGYLSLVRSFLLQEPAAFHTTLVAAQYRHDAGLLGAALLAEDMKL